MCGRFAQNLSSDDLVRIFDLASGLSLTPRYNIAPTQLATIIRGSAAGRQPERLKWGLVPPWADDLRGGGRLINARAETVFDRPSFRKAVRERRCLVPASGWYEWRAEGDSKQAYYFRSEQEPMVTMAGIWETWSGPDGNVETFSILTTAANEDTRAFHHRMPVLLAPGDWSTWLDPHCQEQTRIEPLLCSPPNGLVSALAVSAHVNSVRNDDPRCVEPADTEPRQRSLGFREGYDAPGQ